MVCFYCYSIVISIVLLLYCCVYEHISDDFSTDCLLFSSRPSTPVFDLLEHKYQDRWLQERRAQELAKRKSEQTQVNTPNLRWIHTWMGLPPETNCHRTPGHEIKILSREANSIILSYIEMLCIETSSSLGSLQKFEGAAGEFKGALGSRHPLISTHYKALDTPNLTKSSVSVMSLGDKDQWGLLYH